ncbi:MFS transporter [Pseudogemmobacter bohemicus]|uniref:MFS transporter n=1 Tax=Pseudogemmobacter bohemicus TaxID=2250708 RepID=UPI001E4AB6B7|nr:MFS transporter [Pseudogemmobacter bohemicus]
MISVTYRIDEADREEFIRRLLLASKERMRNGATQWFFHQSVEEPGLWVEIFLLPSWAEHMEQHERVSHTDADLHSDLRALDRHETGPVVRHYIGPHHA